jgi:hypothetical protein
MANPDRPTESPAPAIEVDPPSTEADREKELSSAVVALTGDDVEPSDRRRLLGRLVRLQIRDRGVKDLFKPKQAVQWVADAVADVVPHIPIRDLETLRQHYEGLDGDDLADRLIRNASRVTTGIGAAAGGVAAVEWVATPTLLSAPVLLAAETVAVVAVEIKLIAELHEVYGRPVPGTGLQRAATLTEAWTHRKGVNPFTAAGGMAAALGSAARKRMRDRLLRRLGRNLTTLGPFLTGAAVAGYLNRRSTVALGEAIAKDLKQHPHVIEG